MGFTGVHFPWLCEIPGWVTHITPSSLEAACLPGASWVLQLLQMKAELLAKLQLLGMFCSPVELQAR